MNPIARQVRNMINPYSTALARWWRDSGIYLHLLAMITGRARAQDQAGARLPRTACPPTRRWRSEATP
jgi:hypothetical protein